jgi:hypothetical protein
MNTRGELIGRYYGRKRQPKLTFDIDEINSELVFGNEMVLSKVTLIYMTSAVSRSSANLVTPYATDVIIKYIEMKAAQAEGGTLGKFQLTEQSYANAYRRFKSTMNSLDYAEILGTIRNGIYGSLKN